MPQALERTKSTRLLNMGEPAASDTSSGSKMTHAYVKFTAACTNKGKLHEAKEIVPVGRFYKVKPENLRVQERTYRVQCGERGNLCKAIISLLGESREDVEGKIKNRRPVFPPVRNVVDGTEASSAAENNKANNKKKSAAVLATKKSAGMLALKKLQSLSANISGKMTGARTTPLRGRDGTKLSGNIRLSQWIERDGGYATFSDGAHATSSDAGSYRSGQTRLAANSKIKPANTFTIPKVTNVRRKSSDTENEDTAAEFHEHLSRDTSPSYPAFPKTSSVANPRAKTRSLDRGEKNDPSKSTVVNKVLSTVTERPETNRKGTVCDNAGTTWSSDDHFANTRPYKLQSITKSVPKQKMKVASGERREQLTAKSVPPRKANTEDSEESDSATDDQTALTCSDVEGYTSSGALSQNGSPLPLSPNPPASDTDVSLQRRFDDEFLSQLNEVMRMLNEGEGNDSIENVASSGDTKKIYEVIRRLKMENRTLRRLNLEFQRNELIGSIKIAATIEKVDLEARQQIKSRIRKGKDFSVGFFDDTTGLIHCGFGKWIKFTDYMKYNRDNPMKKVSTSKFMANMARLIFTEKVLARSSVTGQKCNVWREKPRKPALDGISYNAVAAITRYWLQRQNMSNGDIEKEVARLPTVLSKKIADINRQQRRRKQQEEASARNTAKDHSKPEDEDAADDPEDNVSFEKPGQTDLEEESADDPEDEVSFEKPGQTDLEEESVDDPEDEVLFEKPGQTDLEEESVDDPEDEVSFEEQGDSEQETDSTVNETDAEETVQEHDGAKTSAEGLDKTTDEKSAKSQKAAKNVSNTKKLYPTRPAKSTNKPTGSSKTPRSTSGKSTKISQTPVRRSDRADRGSKKTPKKADEPEDIFYTEERDPKTPAGSSKTPQSTPGKSGKISHTPVRRSNNSDRGSKKTPKKAVGPENICDTNKGGPKKAGEDTDEPTCSSGTPDRTSHKTGNSTDQPEHMLEILDDACKGFDKGLEIQKSDVGERTLQPLRPRETAGLNDALQLRNTPMIDEENINAPANDDRCDKENDCGNRCKTPEMTKKHSRSSDEDIPAKLKKQKIESDDQPEDGYVP